MGASVYEKDARRIRSAIDNLRHPSTFRSQLVWDWSRSLVDVDLHRREVYSYGRHFPLFRYVPRRLSGRRDLFVLNGDDVGSQGWGNRSRTPEHQATVRHEVGRIGADSVVIPFSALAGAGIDIDSIRLVHVRPDANWTETVRAGSLEEVPPNLRRSIGESWSSVVGPAADGSYSWTVHRHRLGDCLFSAVREETFMRPARPFEVSSESARETVEVAWRDSVCGYFEGQGKRAPHEAGPAGACVHCGRGLQARVTVRRRARYLSSFDYQERAPLYFLVQVPRGAGDTVDAAIESLAPRAVHAARARGRRVERQGDIFFVETRLTDIDLELRGIVARARLTQWDRDARARKGEVGFAPALTAVERRAMMDDAREDWRRIFRKALLDLTLRDAPAAGPKSAAGARAHHRKARERHAVEVERARAELRACSFGRRIARGHRSDARRFDVYAYYGESQIQANRRELAQRVKRAREHLESLESRTLAIQLGRRSTRDAYRAPYQGTSDVARVAWRMAMAGARARHIPNEHHGPTIEARRARVRDVLAIYGTAHTAREVARVKGGAVYVKGTVSHRPLLDPAGGRDARPDHAPLELPADRWFLAIRNTVPRARGRRA